MHDRQQRAACPAALGAGAMLAALALVGCASAASHRQSDLLELQRTLPGRYGAGAGSSVSLLIQPVTAQTVGDNVYFVRETPADNAQLVLWQGVWALSLEAPARARGHGRARREPRIVQHSFLFKDPRRWIGAAGNPDLFASLLPTDLQALTGCELFWQKTAAGPAGFQTTQVPRTCHPGRQVQGLWIEQQAQLMGRELLLSERRTDADGALDLSEPALMLMLTRTAAAPATAGP